MYTINIVSIFYNKKFKKRFTKNAIKQSKENTQSDIKQP